MLDLTCVQLFFIEIAHREYYIIIWLQLFPKVHNAPPILLCINQLRRSVKMKKVTQTPIGDSVVSPHCAKPSDETSFNNSSQNQRKSIKDLEDGPSRRRRRSQSAGEALESRGNSSLGSLDSCSPAPLARSPYHNFQKHTVVIIQKIARNLCSSLGSSPAEQLARRMWNIFLTSGIRSKKIIIILFGEATLSREKYQALLVRSYFGELCREREEVVRAAQAVLREQVAQLLSEARVVAYIRRNRHIKAKHKFFVYFSELVEQLRQGPLRRFRISLETSRRILDTFQTVSSLSEQPGRQAGRA